MASQHALGTAPLDYLKVFLILFILRLVMLDAGVVLIRIPFFDGMVTYVVLFMRAFVAKYFY